jgi:hypothetical protein
MSSIPTAESEKYEARGGAVEGYKLYNDNRDVPPVECSGGIGVFLPSKLSILFTLARPRYELFLRGGGSTMIYVLFNKRLNKLGTCWSAEVCQSVRNAYEGQGVWVRVDAAKGKRDMMGVQRICFTHNKHL